MLAYLAQSVHSASPVHSQMIAKPTRAAPMKIRYEASPTYAPTLRKTIPVSISATKQMTPTKNRVSRPLVVDAMVKHPVLVSACM